MYISTEALTALAQIIPILLLASYLDKEVLLKVSTYSSKIKYFWLAIVFVILGGEYIAVMGMLEGPVDGIRGFIVIFAFMCALFNLLNIAFWRVLNFDLVSGMPAKNTKARKRKK